jgi:hypothetical protein
MSANAVRGDRRTVSGKAGGKSKYLLPFLSMVAVFSVGLTAGLTTDGVNESIQGWRLRQAAPKKAVMPAHIARLQMVEARAPAVQMTPPPQATAWFPANNQVHWQLGMQAGDVPAALAIQNASMQHNRILHFLIADWQGSWLPTATLYVPAGQQSEIKLPRGRYLVQTIKAPIAMPFDQVSRLTPAPVAQLDLFRPDTSPQANLRLTLAADGSLTSFRLDTLKAASHPDPIRLPVSNGPIPQAQQAHAYVASASRRQAVRHVSSANTEDYSSLLAAALTE